MGLSIKNAEVEEMSRALAARRGITITEAIRQALVTETARAEAEVAERAEELRRRVHATLAKYEHIPRMNDHLTDEEIVGFDENGLPC